MKRWSSILVTLLQQILNLLFLKQKNRKFHYFNILFFQVLNLADNELSELIDGAIEKLHNLVELDLSSNLLDFVPNSLDYLGKNLKILKLSNNLIFHLDDKSFLGKYFIEY